MLRPTSSFLYQAHPDDGIDHFHLPGLIELPNDKIRPSGREVHHPMSLPLAEGKETEISQWSVHQSKDHPEHTWSRLPLEPNVYVMVQDRRVCWPVRISHHKFFDQSRKLSESFSSISLGFLDGLTAYHK
ncbi:hypothetical protein FRB93_011393 [Tulasnella sp. JGI-2019a]|nr:hypothetical protein FRB93_011393 [Tulasnella sp. JGI-2019a]